MDTFGHLFPNDLIDLGKNLDQFAEYVVERQVVEEESVSAGRIANQCISLRSDLLCVGIIVDNLMKIAGQGNTLTVSGLQGDSSSNLLIEN